MLLRPLAPESIFNPQVPISRGVLDVELHLTGIPPAGRISSPRKANTLTNFNELGLDQQILTVLAQSGYEKPTPIQAQAIPLVLAGRDLIGLAQTGTGKTAAFGLPIIQQLSKVGTKPASQTTRALILAPTRELVNQIANNLKGFMKRTHLRVNMVVGGVSINRQQQNLLRGTDILVATPGRLLDLINRRALSLNAVTHLVLDEADQMLDLGFIHDLKRIAKLIPAKRQTLLFSATMPKAIAELADEYLTNPEKVEVSAPGRTADKVEQFVHFVAGKNDKTSILKEQLGNNPDGRAIVFLRTKHGAEKLAKHLEEVGFPVVSIHGNKSQGQRDRALKAFRDGEVAVMVATDVAARGIDIPGVSHVYNYDLPEVPDAYVHRIGRTARAGREGIAIAFCAPDESRLLRDIERLTGIEITVAGGEPHADMQGPGRSGRGARSNRNAGRGGPRRDGAPRGERREGAPRGERRDGAPRGERRDGAPRGERRDGAPFGERREGAPRGERRDDARPAFAREAGNDAPRSDKPRSEKRSNAERPEGARPFGDRAKFGHGQEDGGRRPARGNNNNNGKRNFGPGSAKRRDSHKNAAKA